MAYRRNSASSILEVLSLNPVPYPVLLILAVVFVFLGFQWFCSYESMLETTEENMGWLLMATPVLLLFAVRWLSTIENPERIFGMPPWDRRGMTHHIPSEGSSPWGVAVLILVLLVMVQYQSSFLESWFV